MLFLSLSDIFSGPVVFAKNCSTVHCTVLWSVWFIHRCTSWHSTVSNCNTYSMGQGGEIHSGPRASHIFCMWSFCLFTSAPQQLWGTAAVAILSIGQCFLHKQSKTVLPKEQCTKSLIKSLAEISPSQDISYREEIHRCILPVNGKPICVF